jgi:RNA polymerase sigma factor (sigma-70 family)
VAFARIVATHHGEMIRLAYVVCGDWDTADDAAQAALWSAWRKLPSLHDPGRLRPWLLKVTLNEARQLLRKRRRHAVVQLSAVLDGGPGLDPSEDIGQVDLANALAHLNAEDRALVALRYVADPDSAEIGALIGRSAGRALATARALERLRKDLTDG